MTAQAKPDHEVLAERMVRKYGKTVAMASIESQKQETGGHVPTIQFLDKVLAAMSR